MWIVMAWTETRREPIDIQATRVDLGERPTFVEVQRPLAVVWVRNGTDEDVAKCRCHADAQDNGALVFTYPASETDPIGRAKSDLMP